VYETAAFVRLFNTRDKVCEFYTPYVAEDWMIIYNILAVAFECGTAELDQIVCIDFSLRSDGWRL
jgi:hypothetical protein